MGTEYNQYEFENYLTEEFFDGNEKVEIARLIKYELATNNDFKDQYEQWLEESSYDSWKDLYKNLQDEEDAAWDSMYPDGNNKDE
jgi:hypothetical protein